MVVATAVGLVVLAVGMVGLRRIRGRAAQPVRPVRRQLEVLEAGTSAEVLRQEEMAVVVLERVGS